MFRPMGLLYDCEKSFTRGLFVPVDNTFDENMAESF